MRPRLEKESDRKWTDRKSVKEREEVTGIERDRNIDKDKRERKRAETKVHKERIKKVRERERSIERQKEGNKMSIFHTIE